VEKSLRPGIRLVTQWTRVQALAAALSNKNFGQVVHTYVYASVTKQYNLVPAKAEA